MVYSFLLLYPSLERSLTKGKSFYKYFYFKVCSDKIYAYQNIIKFRRVNPAFQNNFNRGYSRALWNGNHLREVTNNSYASI